MINPSDRYFKWSYQCLIDGREYRVVSPPTRSLSLMSTVARTSCSVALQDMPPQSAHGAVSTVDVTINGKTMRFFTGFVNLDNSSARPRSKSANITDILFRLSRSIKDACGSETGVRFDNTSWSDAIKMTLRAGGISDDEMQLPFWEPDYHVLRTICPIMPICHDSTVNVDGILSSLLEFGGAVATVNPMSGKVMIVAKDRRPTATAAFAFDDRENRSGYPMYSVGRNIGMFNEIVTTMIVTGPTLVDPETGVEGAELRGEYTVADNELRKKGRTESMSNEYVQTQAQAIAIAERETRLRCRYDRSYTLSAAANPALLPGQSITLMAPRIEVPVPTAMYVVAATINGVDMSLDLSSGPSQIGGYAVYPPPIAMFSILVEQEDVLLNENSTEATRMYFVTVDATGSQAFGTEIVSYAWQINGTTSIPAAADVTVPVMLFVMPQVEGVTITLTVTDGHAPPGTASATQAVVSETVQITTRTLTVAAGSNGWRVYTKEGWTQWSGGSDCIAVPPFNTAVSEGERPTLYALLANGTVWVTKDNLKTAAVKVETIPAAPASPVGCIYVNEKNANDILVSRGSKLHRSQDGAKTWSEITPPHNLPIYDIHIGSGGNTNYLRITQGTATWESHDGGINWSEANAIGAGATATHMGIAEWGSVVVGTGVNGQLGSDGGAILPVNIGSVSDQFTSITPFALEEGFAVGTNSGNRYAIRKSGGQWIVEPIGSAAPSRHRHVLRDGLLHPKVYEATETDTRKTMYTTGASTSFRILPFGSYRIGYGILGDEIILPDTVKLWLSVGNAGLFEWDGSQWLPADMALTQQFTGVNFGITGRAVIAVNPSSPTDRVAAFEKRIFRKTPSGWSEVTPSGVTQNISSIAMTDNNRWLTGSRSIPYNQAVEGKPDGTTVVHTIGNYFSYLVTRGVGNDLVMSGAGVWQGVTVFYGVGGQQKTMEYGVTLFPENITVRRTDGAVFVSGSHGSTKRFSMTPSYAPASSVMTTKTWTSASPPLPVAVRFAGGNDIAFAYGNYVIIRTWTGNPQTDQDVWSAENPATLPKLYERAGASFTSMEIVGDRYIVLSLGGVNPNPMFVVVDKLGIEEPVEIPAPTGVGSFNFSPATIEFEAWK